MSHDRLQQLRDELQGNILAPYVGAHCARMYLVSFKSKDIGARQAWVRRLCDHVSFGFGSPLGQSTFVNIAFSSEGLRALGLDETELSALPAPFREGMRARGKHLGDPPIVGGSKWFPDLSTGSLPVHALLMVHATPDDELRELLRSWGAAARAASETPNEQATLGVGATDAPRHDAIAAFLDKKVDEHLGSDLFASAALEISQSDLHSLLDEHYRPIEYFGFRDGMSQPELLTVEENEGRDAHLLGHFVIGAGSPLQVNGSFLVVRQLQQHVERFWDQVREKCATEQVSPRELAERIVGRRMNGDRLDGSSGTTAFDPGAGDDRCPFHSHARRLNPQIDAKPESNPRLIRRSISYAEGAERGLMFMAYNANIEQQFEFMQRNWVQRGNHVGLCSRHVDPFSGFSSDKKSNGSADPNFTTRIGERDLALELSSAVSYRGGGYFLAPSRSALQHIAGLAPAIQAKSRVAANPVEAELAACASDDDRLELIQRWIDGPLTGGSFWRYVLEQERAGNAVRISKKSQSGTKCAVVFIADRALVQEVLVDREGLFSVEEYGRRMRATFGNFMLGMDKAAHDLEYRANQVIPGANLYGHFRKPPRLERLLDVQKSAKAVAESFLTRQEAQAALRNGNPEVKLNELMAVVLGAMAARYFGITDLSAGTLLVWSGAIARRHFRFETDRIDEMKAREAASLLMAHVLSLIALAREQQRDGSIKNKQPDDPAVILLGLLDEVRDGLERTDDDAARSLSAGRANDHDLARNLIGIALGSMAATAKAVGEAFLFFAGDNIRRGTPVVWPERADLLADEADPTVSNSLFSQIIERTLCAACRGSLDSVYRTYRGEQPWQRGNLRIAEHDTVVVWLGGAEKNAAIDPLFGAGIHKCPGMDMAKAIMNGVLQVLASTHVVPRIDDEEQLVLRFKRSAKTVDQLPPGGGVKGHAEGFEDHASLTN